MRAPIFEDMVRAHYRESVLTETAALLLARHYLDSLSSSGAEFRSDEGPTLPSGDKFGREPAPIRIAVEYLSRCHHDLSMEEIETRAEAAVEGYRSLVAGRRRTLAGTR